MEKDLFGEPINEHTETPKQKAVDNITTKTRNAVEKIITPKDFTKLFDQISYGLSPFTVFNDFLDMSIYAFTLGKHEDEYLEIVNRYPKEKVNQLAELLGILVLAMNGNANSLIPENQPYDAGANDILGEFYMDRFYNSRTGQYFTPQSIADFMAIISCGDSTEFIGRTVCDPACGSGRMLLAAKKINPHNYFYGADLDETCCKMAGINLFLNGVKGEIAHMNSLSMDFYKAFKLSGLPRPEITIVSDKKDSVFFTTAQNMKKNDPEKFEEQIIKNAGTANQLRLF